METHLQTTDRCRTSERVPKTVFRSRKHPLPHWKTRKNPIGHDDIGIQCAVSRQRPFESTTARRSSCLVVQKEQTNPFLKNEKSNFAVKGCIFDFLKSAIMNLIPFD